MCGRLSDQTLTLKATAEDSARRPLETTNQSINHEPVISSKAPASCKPVRTIDRGALAARNVGSDFVLPK